MKSIQVTKATTYVVDQTQICGSRSKDGLPLSYDINFMFHGCSGSVFWQTKIKIKIT